MNSFKPTQAQKWDLIAAFRYSMASKRSRIELRCWSLLGILSLAIAGIFALLLAVSRIPNSEFFFTWPVKFFEKGLVVHVIFSFVIWFFSVFSALSTIAIYRLSEGKPKMQFLGFPALLLAVVAFFLIFVPGLLNDGEPSLNNYIPVIIDPIYYLGLAIFFFSIFLQFIRLLINLSKHQGPVEPISKTIMVAGFIYLISFFCFLKSLVGLWGDPLTPALNESIFWAPGHVLQFFNTLLMLLAWYVLGSLKFQQPILSPKFFCFIVWAFGGAGLFLLTLVFIYDPISSLGREAFTNAQFLMLPLVLLFFIGVFENRQRLNSNLRIEETSRPVSLFFLFSVIIFCIGGILGLFVDGTDTRTPAHYHAVIGGVNLSFMGLFFFFIVPILNHEIVAKRTLLIITWCYGLGQTLHSLGLFFAGGYGAPRKTPGNISGLDALGAELSLYCMGLGAIIAVIGGTIFVVIAGKALLAMRS